MDSINGSASGEETTYCMFQHATIHLDLQGNHCRVLFLESLFVTRSAFRSALEKVLRNHQIPEDEIVSLIEHNMGTRTFS